jgi:hypothetical protein
VIEDFRAIDRLTADAWPKNGPARQIVAELLKTNPVFALGVASKLSGDGRLFWRGRPEMLTEKWDAPLAAARKRWEAEEAQAWDEGVPPSGPWVRCVIRDRLLALSNGLGCPRAEDFFLRLPNQNSAGRDEVARFFPPLLRCRDRRLVRQSASLLMHARVEEAVDEVCRIADGPDRELADDALSALSNLAPNSRATAFLRRKMTDADPQLALSAAVVSCYSGDGSGLAFMLRCARHPDPKVRLEAAAMLGGVSQVRRTDRIQPLLLERLGAESDPAVLERVIESLGVFTDPKVLEAIRPFLSHSDERVRVRAKLVSEHVAKVLGRKQLTP